MTLRDDQLIERVRRLYTAVVADSLDKVGIRGNVMQPYLRPLYRRSKCAGFAMTVQAIDVDHMPNSPDDYYKGELQAVDALRDGDIMVVSHCHGSYWGELLATAAPIGAREAW